MLANKASAQESNFDLCNKKAIEDQDKCYANCDALTEKITLNNSDIEHPVLGPVYSEAYQYCSTPCGDDFIKNLESCAAI